MNPYRVKMHISGMSVMGEPLYTLTEYDKDGNVVERLVNVSKDVAVASVAALCGKIYIARQNGKR